MSNLDLATLHLAVRYEKHVNDLVDEIYKVHKNICELCKNEKLTEKDLDDPNIEAQITKYFQEQATKDVSDDDNQLPIKPLIK